MYYYAPTPILEGLKNPSSSVSSSGSVSLDYSGQDAHLARQDEIAKLRDRKFASLYGGDIPGSVEVGNRIRDLLGVVRGVTPGATERRPHQMSQPLVRATSMQSTTSASNDGGEVKYAIPKAGDMKVPDGGGVPPGKQAKPAPAAPAAPPPPRQPAATSEDRLVEEGQRGIVDESQAKPRKRPKPDSPFGMAQPEMYA